MITRGYYNIHIGKYWQIQIYYPEIHFDNIDIMIRLDQCFRIMRGDSPALAFTFIFGIGIIYYKKQRELDILAIKKAIKDCKESEV